jgi:3',5'-cyclic AMP phosphodiesterase CpdA
VNTDVTSTFQDALNAVTLAKPAFLIQTGDITHLSKAEQFDAGSQLLGATGLHAYSVPGEHDILEDDGRSCGC